MVIAKLITIGDEILIGQIENSNASYICHKLYCIGIKVCKVVTIGDNTSDLLAELQDSSDNYDLTIMTGGLGPTHDDITKSILCSFMDDELVFNNEVLEHIKKFFLARGYEMPETNNEQALIPSKAKVIWNNNGTAPGIYMEKNQKIFIAIPGVPFEMKDMIDNSITNMLKIRLGDKIDYLLQSKTLLTTGISESLLFEKIGNPSEFIKEHNLAFLPSPLGVRLRIDVKGVNETEVKNEINRIETILREKAGDYIFGENDDLLEKIIGNLLIKNNQTLSTAESCTGGLISKRITDIAGSSQYFFGGITAYSNLAKITLLNVKAGTLEKFGAVSEQTAIEMAEGARSIFKTSLAVSVTGIAGPAGETDEKKVGTTYIGFSSADKSYAIKFIFGDNRERNRIRAAQAALNIIRKEITS